MSPKSQTKKQKPRAAHYYSSKSHPSSSSPPSECSISTLLLWCPESFRSILSNAPSAALIVAIVAAISFFNSLSGDFIFDDAYAILRNKDVVDVKFTSWSDLWYHDFWGVPMTDPRSHKSFRPLVVATFRLNYITTGLNTFGYHLVNVLFHMVASVLVFYSSFFLFYKQITPAIFSALLFAVHPVHCDSVASIVGRAEVMALCFALLSFLSSVIAAKRSSTDYIHVAMALFFLFAAVLSKEPAITIMALQFFYDLLYVFDIFEWIQHESRAPSSPFFTSNRSSIHSYAHKKIDHPESDKDNDKAQDRMLQDAVPPPMLQAIKRNWTSKRASVFVTRQGVYIVASLIILFWRLGLNNNVLPTWPIIDYPAAYEPHILPKILNFPYMFAKNLLVMVFPKNLSIDYTHYSFDFIQSFQDWRYWLSCSTILSLFILFFAAFYYRSPQIIISILLLVITFFPASNWILKVGFTFAERVLYTPSMFICTLFVALLYHISAPFTYHRGPRLSSTLLGVIIALVIIAFSARTIVRNSDWASEKAIWESAVKTLPRNVMARSNYAHSVMDDQNFEKAIQLYKDALDIDPNCLSSLINIAFSYAKSNNFDQALVYYEKVSKIQPHLGQIINYANILEHKGQLDLALEVFKNCSIIMKQGTRANLYQDDFSVKPMAAMKAAIIYCRRGNSDECIKWLYHSVTLDPNFAEAWMRLGLEHSQIRQEYPQAKLALDNCIRLEQHNEHCIRELGHVNAMLQSSRN